MSVFSSEDLLTSPADFTAVYTDAATFWATDGLDQSQINVFLLDRAEIERFPLRLATGINGWRFSDSIYLRVTINGPRDATPIWALVEEDRMSRPVFGSRFFRTTSHYLLGRNTIFRNSAAPNTLIYHLPLQVYTRMAHAYNHDWVNSDPNTGAPIPYDGLCGIFQQSMDGGGHTIYRVAFTIFRYNPRPAAPTSSIRIGNVIVYEFNGGGGGGGTGANIPANVPSI